MKDKRGQIWNVFKEKMGPGHNVSIRKKDSASLPFLTRGHSVTKLAHVILK